MSKTNLNELEIYLSVSNIEFGSIGVVLLHKQLTSQAENQRGMSG